jgi:hypothetical protein
LTFFVVFSSSFRQMLGKYFGSVTAVSFQILSSSSFMYDPTIRHYIVQLLSTSYKNPHQIHTASSSACTELNSRMSDEVFSSYCSHLKHRASVKRFVSLHFLNLRTPVGLLGRRISPSQGRCLHRTTQTQNKRRQIFLPSVGFEPTIPTFDRAATVIGEW